MIEDILSLIAVNESVDYCVRAIYLGRGEMLELSRQSFDGPHPCLHLGKARPTLGDIPIFVVDAFTHLGVGVEMKG